MKLSDDLKKWRAERPDEWTMDRFIRAAEKLEDTPPPEDPFIEDVPGFTMPPSGFDPGIIEGEWPESCLQRAFVDGAKWWQYHSNGATMFSSERHEAEDEAIRRYGKL